MHDLQTRSSRFPGPIGALKFEQFAQNIFPQFLQWCCFFIVINYDDGGDYDDDDDDNDDDDRKKKEEEKE